MEKSRIALIGPVYPYKGGIAHYTSLLYRILTKKYDVSMISFSLQYPSFLYPGKEQKDYENEQFKINDAKYIINSINPFSWIYTAIHIIRKSPKLIIFQWWNPFFSPAYTLICLLVKAFSSTKVLYLCHNVLPHEKLPFDKQLAIIALRRGDRFIVQSGEDEDKLIKLIPTANYKRTYLPTYNVFNYGQYNEADARNKLCLNKHKVLLFFGFVREYKGLIYLIKALPNVVKKYKEIKLLIVGDFYDDKQEYLDEINRLNMGDYINIYDGYIPDKEVEMYFKASDLVVLPYTSATQSGIVQIAYGFEKPVIVTDVGGLPEVVENGKTGFVVCSKDVEKLSKAIVQYFDENRKEVFIKNIQNDQDKYSWDKMVEVIEGLTEVTF
ncbi:MAG: glycosyltransferase [Clostridia bacterium]